MIRPWRLCLVAAAALVSSFTAGAQLPPGRLLAPELVRYLELTPAQSASLVAVNAEWIAYLREKTVRVGQIQNEIDQETREPQPDPVALGERYRELEAICRDARERDAALQRRARQILNPAQTQRLATLTEAFALYPIIAQAQSTHLVDRSLTSAPLGLPEGQLSQEYTLVRSTEPLYPGCRAPIARGRPGILPVVP